MVKKIDKSFLRQNWFIRASWNNKKNVQADKKWIRKKGESYKANTEQGTVRYCERSQTIQREQGGARETQKVSTRIQKKKLRKDERI